MSGFHHLLKSQNLVYFECLSFYCYKAAGILCIMAAKVSKILNFDWNLGAIQTFSLSLLEICSISSFAVNALFLAVFALILAILFSLGIRYRTWGFLSGLLGGFLFELIGYIGRVQLHYNDWPVSPFLM